MADGHGSDGEQKGPWGGRRKGAGRKPKGEKPLVSHDSRPPHHQRYPVHVTMRTVANLPSLRGKRMFPVVQDAIRRAQRDSFRVVEFAVLGNHVHFIVEGDEGSDDRRLPLIRGIHGMAVRIAIAVNRTLARRGKVWRDRYHARALKTALQVKNCLRYVMHNGRKHYDLGPGIDLCSSGPWSSCWSEPPLRPDGPCPVVPARSWLLREGWRKLGPIGFDERPAMAGARQRSGTSQQHIGVKGMTAE